MRTIHDGGGTEICNGISIFGFFSIFKYRICTGYIFFSIFSTGFIPFINWKIFLVIFF